MAAVAAAEGQGAVLEIGKHGHRPAGDRDDLGRPAHVRIAHRDRPATVVAPGIGLDKGEVRIPSDVDARQRLAGHGEEGGDLRLVALKQHHLDRQARFLVKVSSHALPDTDHLRIVCDGTYPDRPAHDCFSPVTLDIQMRSIRLPSAAKRRSALASEQRYSQDWLADELAQNVARRRHHSARMGIAEQPLDGHDAWKTPRLRTPASPPR